MVSETESTPTVLVIDDEESMREGCRQALESRGYRAALAADGEAGLRLVDEVRPNVALVDLVMPGLGGIDVIQRIHAVDPRVVIIVITFVIWVVISFVLGAIFAVGLGVSAI